MSCHLSSREGLKASGTTDDALPLLFSIIVIVIVIVIVIAIVIVIVILVILLPTGHPL